MTASPLVPGLDARNYLQVLSLIDRTILPRRLLLTNGSLRLVLTAARQRAWLEDEGGGQIIAVERLAAAIARLCTAGRPIACRMEAAVSAPSPDAGFAPVAIVNAQERPELHDGPDRKQYRFTASGWPVAAPPAATFASLAAAARIAWTLSGWKAKSSGRLEPPMLLLAISEGFPETLSVSVEGGVAVTSTPPAHLGRLVSGWRQRAGDA
jgi:hypothetical protein